MTRLVLGSRNAKKLAELVGLLGDLPLDLADLTPYPDAPEVDETGTTFAANAALKAQRLAPALKTWVLGEDSGLVVPALGGEPGVDSARYAGTHGDDAANNAKLLHALAGKAGRERDAYYVSSICLADPAGTVVATSEGRCGGRIAESPRGSGGFGYDPLFVIRECHKSFGELSSATVKQALSHRGRAVGLIRPAIIRHVVRVSPFWLQAHMYLAPVRLRAPSRDYLPGRARPGGKHARTRLPPATCDRFAEWVAAEQVSPASTAPTLDDLVALRRVPTGRADSPPPASPGTS